LIAVTFAGAPAVDVVTRYGAPVAKQSGTALLVMDFQTGIIGRLDSLEVVDAAVRAVGAARAHSVNVIFVRVGFRPGYPEVSPANASFAALATSGADFTESGPTTQLDPAFVPEPDEPVVLKRRVSAFAGSDLDVILRAQGVHTLVLAGISTSGVVLSTMREAADRDFRLVVLSDACADLDDEVHRVLTEKIFPRQGAVLTVDAWAATLVG
jgi:nicotinamidase-related amidase